MTATPKGKQAPAPSGASPARAPADRTSTVVAGTLILLTVLGVLTVFWEPLAALAEGGSPGSATESPGEMPSGAPDAGTAAASPTAIASVDAAGNS